MDQCYGDATIGLKALKIEVPNLCRQESPKIHERSCGTYESSRSHAALKAMIIRLVSMARMMGAAA